MMEVLNPKRWRRLVDVIPCPWLFLNFQEKEKHNLPLKRLCQEDIAILGQQFCAEVFTQGLYTYPECSCRVMKNPTAKFIKEH